MLLPVLFCVLISCSLPLSAAVTLLCRILPHFAVPCALCCVAAALCLSLLLCRILPHCAALCAFAVHQPLCLSPLLCRILPHFAALCALCCVESLFAAFCCFAESVAFCHSERALQYVSSASFSSIAVFCRFVQHAARCCLGAVSRCVLLFEGALNAHINVSH